MSMSQQPPTSDSCVTTVPNGAWHLRAGLHGGVLTLILLLVSLAFYSEVRTGWVMPGHYDIDVTHVALGVPQWLVINRWEVRGTVPPYALPHGTLYRRGWYVRPFRFLVAALVCAGLAALMHWAALRVPAPRTYRPYAVAILLAALIGALLPAVPRASFWIGTVLIFGLLPVAMVVASVFGRNYWYASAMGVAAMVMMWASSRISDVLIGRCEHGPPDADDLMAASLFIPGALLIVLIGTTIARWRDACRRT